MNTARTITRGTALVNTSPAPEQGTAKVFGVGQFLGGLVNIGAAAINAGTNSEALSAAERQAEADRAAKAQRQAATFQFLAGTVLTIGIIAIIITILK